MAFNAIKTVLIDGATREILVKGESDPPLDGDDAKFVVAVAAIDELTRRTQGDDTDSPTSSDWTTRLAQPAEGEPFEEGDEVFVSAVATCEGRPPFVWGESKRIDLKPV